MADRVESFTVTCNANTTQIAAIEVDTAFDSGTVEQIEILIPSGHAYLTGIALAVAHQIIIPRSGNNWYIGDGDTHDLFTSNYPESGAWSVFLYNKDEVYSHAWQVRYHVSDLQPTTPQPIVEPIPVSDIYAAARVV